MGSRGGPAGSRGGGSAEWPPPRLAHVFLAPGILLKYLQEQNRPYSAQDVFGNLQREHGLGKAVRTLLRDSPPWGASNQPEVLPSSGCRSSLGLPRAVARRPLSLAAPPRVTLIASHPPLCQAVVKALEQLAQQGKIKEKMYGKQKIYFADQVREACTDSHPREGQYEVDWSLV